MPAPNLPGLTFNSVTVSGLTTAALWHSGLGAASYATGDDGVAIPAASLWVAAAGTGYVAFVPAATSPIAGKVVLIFAGTLAGTIGATGMLGSEASTVACLYFGMYMADAGQTVGVADITGTWDQNSIEGPFNGTNGTFTGWNKFYTAAAAMNKAFVFLSNDYLVFQMEEVTGGTFWCGGGMGIRACSDTLGESGLGGRIFDFFTSGSTTAVAAGFSTQSDTTSGTPTGYLATAGVGKWYARIPGQNVSANVSTMRPCASRAATGAVVSFVQSDVSNMLDESGNIEPESMPVIDRGTGGRTKRKVGRSRVFFYGPKRKTKAILSVGGVKKWIACGQSSTVDNDCYLLPYA
jgi:hypothetical protein